MAAIYNAAPFQKSKVLTAADIFPGALADGRDEEPQTLEEQIRILTAVMGCGPKVN